MKLSQLDRVAIATTAHGEYVVALQTKCPWKLNKHIMVEVPSSMSANIICVLFTVPLLITDGIQTDRSSGRVGVCVRDLCHWLCIKRDSLVVDQWFPNLFRRPPSGRPEFGNHYTVRLGRKGVLAVHA